MTKVIEIPGRTTLRCEATIRPLFENTGCPGYFSLAMEIPPHFLDMEMPKRNYWLVIRDEKAPRLDLQRRELLLPSIQQVLWAIGFMNIELANVIAEKPIRFLHQPFRAYMCPWKQSQAWRQIYVRQTEGRHFVETVCVTDISPDSLLGYVLPN